MSLCEKILWLGMFVYHFIFIKRGPQSQLELPSHIRLPLSILTSWPLASPASVWKLITPFTKENLIWTVAPSHQQPSHQQTWNENIHYGSFDQSVCWSISWNIMSKRVYVDISLLHRGPQCILMFGRNVQNNKKSMFEWSIQNEFCWCKFIWIKIASQCLQKTLNTAATFF